MNSSRFRAACLALLWLASAAALPYLPDPTPTHWNGAGEVDRYGPPLVAALLGPVAATVVAILTPLLPRIDPRGQRYLAFADTYQRFMTAIVIVLTATHMLTLAYALDLPVPVAPVPSIAVGLLFVLVGNELGRVQPNFFVCIRTPWTLADSEVWRRTHRVGGRAFVALGAVVALAPLLLPASAVGAVTAGSVIGAVVVLFAYSYWVWRGIAQQGQ